MMNAEQVTDLARFLEGLDDLTLQTGVRITDYSKTDVEINGERLTLEVTYEPDDAGKPIVRYAVTGGELS